TVRLDVTGPLARLTLDRPEVLNAGDARFARELKEVVAALGARPEVRVVVVTGEGRAFSTGVDLGALAHGEFGMADFVLWEDAMTAMERMDTLFVAGINGDRKSTRLNSSHVSISYAVFCLKKKRELSCSTASLAHYRCR